MSTPTPSGNEEVGNNPEDSAPESQNLERENENEADRESAGSPSIMVKKHVPASPSPTPTPTSQHAAMPSRSVHTPSTPSPSPLMTIDMTGLQFLIQNIQKEHLEMKAIVNKFTAGLGQLDLMNNHMERMASEVAHMRVAGVGGGGGGGMPKEIANQWESLTQTVQLNNSAIKEAYRNRAEMQMQISTLDAQVQALRDGEGWRDQLEAVGDASTNHEGRLAELEQKVAEQETQAQNLGIKTQEAQQEQTQVQAELREIIESLQVRIDSSEMETSELLNKLNRATKDMKEEVAKHTEDLKNVHDAAAVSCTAQLELMDSLRGDIKDVQLRLDPNMSEERRLEEALVQYDKCVEEEAGERNVWARMKRRAGVSAQLCLAVSGGIAACGKRQGGVSDKAVQRVIGSVDKLKVEVEELEGLLGAHDKKVSGHSTRMQLMEDELKKLASGGLVGRGEDTVTWTAMESAITQHRENQGREIQLIVRRVDELAGQAEKLTEEKMDTKDSITRQYLEKCIGEISTEFAAALQRNRQEVNRYLNDKAQADVLADMEGRFGQRLQQMESILMKGVKGLDERASQALAKKADFQYVQRIQDKVELLMAMQHENKRSISPTAAAFRGNSCISCDQIVRSAQDEFVMRQHVKMTTGKLPFDSGGALPQVAPWHNSFGGMVAGDLKGASRNARLNSREQSRSASRGLPARFRERPNSEEPGYHPGGPDGEMGGMTGTPQGDHQGMMQDDGPPGEVWQQQSPEPIQERSGGEMPMLPHPRKSSGGQRVRKDSGQSGHTSLGSSSPKGRKGDGEGGFVPPGEGILPAVH